jgi:hypothetical protein
LPLTFPALSSAQEEAFRRIEVRVKRSDALARSLDEIESRIDLI